MGDVTKSVPGFIKIKLIEHLRKLGVQEHSYNLMIARVISDKLFMREIRYFNMEALAITLYLFSGNANPNRIFNDRQANQVVASYLKGRGVKNIPIKNKTTILRYARAIRAFESERGL